MYYTEGFCLIQDNKNFSFRINEDNFLQKSVLQNLFLITVKIIHYLIKIFGNVLYIELDITLFTIDCCIVYN